MTPEEVVAKFAHSIDQFEPIAGQPSDSDLTRVLESVVPLLLHILYDETGAVHNLIGLIWPEAAYFAHYCAEFTKPARFRAYKPSIDNNATDAVRTRTEVAHKAKCKDRAMYETA